MKNVLCGRIYFNEIRTRHSDGKSFNYSIGEFFPEMDPLYSFRLDCLKFYDNGVFCKHPYSSQEDRGQLLGERSHALVKIEFDEAPHPDAFFIELNDDQCCVDSNHEINLFLPFELLGEIDQRGLTVEVRLHVLDYTISEESSSEWKAAHGQLSVDVLSVKQGNHIRPHLAAVGKTYCTRYFFGEFTQSYYCFDDLCENLAASSKSFIEMIEKIKLFNGIFSEIRYLLRDPNHLNSRTNDDPWSMQKSEFEVLMTSKSDNFEKSKKAYDTIWQPLNFTTVFENGQQHAGPESRGYQLNNIDEILRQIRVYRQAKFRSKAFERICVDLLAYAESEFFARSAIAAPVTVGSLSLTGKILSSSERSKHQFKKALWKWFLGAMKIAATFFGVALIPDLTPAQIYGFVLAITLFRWLPRPDEKIQEQKITGLLVKLSTVNTEITSHPGLGWNAGIVQSLVKDAVLSGVSYKHEMHHLLDRLVSDERNQG